MARDLLSVQASTVASEFDFSISGRDYRYEEQDLHRHLWRYVLEYEEQLHGVDVKTGEAHSISDEEIAIDVAASSAMSFEAKEEDKHTPYLKTLKNSRPLPDFEEYAIDTPYMILWSKIKKNTFSANTPYPKTPILRIGQYSVSKKSDMAYWSIRRIQKSDMAYPIPAQEFWNILFLEPTPSNPDTPY
ncbi:hypothetical protein Tco_0025769 [Tanacetum coccineum]